MVELNKAIKARMKELNLNVAQLAKHSGLSDTSVRTALKFGSWSLASLQKIDSVLNTNFSNARQSAEAELGSYSKDLAIEAWVGKYQTIRPSKTFDSYLVFDTDLYWSNEKFCMCFCEEALEIKNEKHGKVALFINSDIAFFLSNSSRGLGYKQITVSRDPLSGDMYGISLTLTQTTNGSLVPTAFPTIFLKSKRDFKSGNFTSNQVEYAILEAIFDNALAQNRIKFA